MAKRPVPKYDFKAFGAAIKAAREGRKESRKNTPVCKWCRQAYGNYKKYSDDSCVHTHG